MVSTFRDSRTPPPIEGDFQFAGHGAARIIELAGKVKDGKDRDGKDTVVADSDDVDLDNNQARTDALFTELMNHMDPASPNHRVIFNACLTNSNAVQGPLDPDPVKAQAQIKAAIAKDASLATTFREKAKAMGKDIDSRGANGSRCSTWSPRTPTTPA